MAVEGFNPLLDFTNFNINGVPIESYFPDFRYALSNAILQRTIGGTSTLTLQLTDPTRAILNAKNHTDGSYLLQHGLSVSIHDPASPNPMVFMLAQFTKASDQAQLVLEAEAVYRLRTLNNTNSGPIATTGDINAFFQSLIDECNQVYGSNYKLVAASYNAYGIYLVAGTSIDLSGLNDAGTASTYSRGNALDLTEDSWTAMQRVAGTLGWRFWESNGTFFIGPDEYWLGLGAQKGVYPVNALYGKTTLSQLQEFTTSVQLIDYDWDIGKPFGSATATCMLDFFDFYPGEIINLHQVGPATGNWMVFSIQRDLFNPQSTITCQIPMPSNAIIQSTNTITGRPLG